MYTEDLIVNHSCQGQVVENFCAVAPDIYRAILSEAFIIETVNLCDLSALMITSDKRDPFWVSHLKKLRVSISALKLKCDGEI